MSDFKIGDHVKVAKSYYTDHVGITGEIGLIWFIYPEVKSSQRYAIKALCNDYCLEAHEFELYTLKNKPEYLKLEQKINQNT